MDLTRTLLRYAAARPHVLVVGAPGGTEARLAVERELRVRGWPNAASPAEADLLVVTGPVGPALAPFVERLWQQVPGPRVRAELRDATDVRAALDAARRQLGWGGEPLQPAAGEHHEPAAGEHHEGMQPGGLPMPDRGEDRDGLMLDQLHVPLGPLLPDWPAGLVVHTTLQGDVVQEARVEVVREDHPVDSFWSDPWHRAAAGAPVSVGYAARHRGAAHLDSLARLLAVAGWSDAALRARRLRDDVLAGARAEQVTPRLRRLARRLRGSRTLRWLTDRLGVPPTGTAAAAGVPGAAPRAEDSGGDVSARWQAWLADLEQTLPDVDEAGPLPPGSEDPRGPLGDRGRSAALLAALPRLLPGAELATARLVVASLDPDPAELVTPLQVPDG